MTVLSILQRGDPKLRFHAHEIPVFPVDESIRQLARAYGNAIVAPLAAEFVKAYMDCRPT